MLALVNLVNSGTLLIATDKRNRRFRWSDMIFTRALQEVKRQIFADIDGSDRIATKP